MSSSEVWDAANAICANAARQSRCDANAALTIWDAVDAAIAIGAAIAIIAAIWRHADTAANSHCQMLSMQHGDLGVAKPAIVSMFHAVIASLFRFCFACFEPCCNRSNVVGLWLG